MEPHRPRPSVTKSQWLEIEALFKKESPGLVRYARGRFGLDGDDVVQETFHDVTRDWAKIGQYTPEERQRWLFQVVHNKAVDLLRKTGRNVPCAELPEMPSQSDDPSDQAAIAIALEQVVRAIRHLPPRAREVADLVWLKGWSTERVAKHLGVAPPTVRGHLAVARRLLKEELGHLMPFTDEDEEGPTDEQR